MNSTILVSLVRSFTMITGEINALETVITPLADQSPNGLHFREIIVVFEILFIITMPILLINLMV